jgi:hypothetical protein
MRKSKQEAICTRLKILEAAAISFEALASTVEEDSTTKGLAALARGHFSVSHRGDPSMGCLVAVLGGKIPRCEENFATPQLRGS